MTFQVAVANGHFYLGLDDFVIGALDRQAGDSLASNARYQKAISAAPADNAGIGLRSTSPRVASSSTRRSCPQTDGRRTSKTNTKPFLDPLSSLSFVGHVDGGMLRQQRLSVRRVTFHSDFPREAF